MTSASSSWVMRPHLGLNGITPVIRADRRSGSGFDGNGFPAAQRAYPATCSSRSTHPRPSLRLGPAASIASLQADLLNARHRAERLAARVRQLERKLSTLLGEHAWRESGLGASDDLDELKQQNADLERYMIDLRLQLDERDQDLAAARSGNRELMAHLNTTARR
jgi:hypothetical protein